MDKMSIRFERVDGADVARARAIMAGLPAGMLVADQTWTTQAAGESRAEVVALVERQLDELTSDWREFIAVS